MKYINKLYYKNFSITEIPLNIHEKETLQKILYEEEYVKFLNQSDSAYLIIFNNSLIGFFSLALHDHCLEIPCLYIFEEYRNKSIAKEVVNDITFSAKHNLDEQIKYFVSNSFAESAMFFLKIGFEYCKINQKIEYKGKKIILMYKEV